MKKIKEEPLKNHISLDSYDEEFFKYTPSKGQEHPTPEQLLIRQAIKYLTPKQKQVWELHNYDRLTQDEIAKKLNMKQPNVTISLKAIEKRIAKFVQHNLGAYELLKRDYND